MAIFHSYLKFPEANLENTFYQFNLVCWNSNLWMIDKLFRSHILDGQIRRVTRLENFEVFIELEFQLKSVDWDSMAVTGHPSFGGLSASELSGNGRTSTVSAPRILFGIVQAHHPLSSSRADVLMKETGSEVRRTK